MLCDNSSERTFEKLYDLNMENTLGLFQYGIHAW